MTFSRRDVILASFAVFVAWGLVVKWIPVLRYIWYAFVAGVIVACVAILIAILTTARNKHSRIARDTVPSGSLAFLDRKRWSEEVSNLASSRTYQALQLYPKSSVISRALDGILSFALRDFISSWYGNITKSPAFVNEIDRSIKACLVDIRDRVLREDVVDIIVSRFVPIFTAHLKDFDLAERTIRAKSLGRNITESEELDLAIAGRYRDGKLHGAASLAFPDTKHTQQEHLRKILVRILPEVLPESVLKSRAAAILIKEITACAALYPVLQILSDPDTWNQLIEAYGRTALQDRKTVRRMRAALDEHASPMPKTRPVEGIPSLGPGDSERGFERFVRAIRRINNLSDARRTRSQVVSQLKREAVIEGQDPTYIRRLEAGKRVLDQRVANLVSVGGPLSAAMSQSNLQDDGLERPRELSLEEILRNSSGLSYFMEYMDRQGLMSLVQFWVVVDGFRNPLEDDLGDDSSSPTRASWTDADRLDIAQISEAYMSKAEVRVSPTSQNNIKDFLTAGRKATSRQYRAARTAILSAQSSVFDELQDRHLPHFRMSDLYSKFLATDHSAAQRRRKARDVTARTDAPAQLDRRAVMSATRASSQPFLKSKDLRRAATSSTDVKSLSSSRLSEDYLSARRSFDHDGSTPLFDDDYDTDPLAHSTHSLGYESTNGDPSNRRQVIENMEAALNDIMTESPSDNIWDEQQERLSPALSYKSVKPFERQEDPFESPPVEGTSAEKSRPSLATLGLVNPSSRIGVFTDNDLFGDEERFIEDEYVDPEVADDKDESEEPIHEAAPGDLGLTEAITVLSNDIERLVAQESVVDTLTRKAELTNNVAELRILGKSKSSLQREIRRKELQRQQYIVQESDNSLYGRSSIAITSVMVGREDDGREFALYVIEVQRRAGDQMPAATWAIARRYSEFHDLYRHLRRRYPSTRNLEFPRRRMVLKLQKQFLHNRRAALETYLQELIGMPDVCRSRELRSFLSQQAIMPHEDVNSASDAQDIVTRIYNSVTDGMNDFLGNVTALDQLSAAGQNLISAATSQLGTTQASVVHVNSTLEPGSIAEAEAELRAFEDRELEPFVKPICDIFLEIFELNRGNNWLRGRAVVVVLHQLLGGTVERKIRDLVKGATQEESVLRYIDVAKETMWPAGQLRESKPRTAAEKAKSKEEASFMLATLVPDTAASVVGRANAQNAARKISAAMNNQRLNTHLVYWVLDEVVGVLFGKDGRPPG